ncbi:MAG: hypothetical protein KUG77_26175 [Nannocystaceae bacterium]|nr:hypothetical protein [Nannocystaceae bacterium]
MACVRSASSALVFLTMACASSPPSRPAGLLGGHEDFEAQPGLHFVSYQGNSTHSRTDVVRGWHDRAAELCGGHDRYEIVDQATQSQSQQIGRGTGHVQGRAVTAGNTTEVEGRFVDTSLRIERSRAEGHVRCQQNPTESRLEKTGWCISGLFDGRSAAACRATLDACAQEAQRMRDAGLEGASKCERSNALVCVGATKADSEDSLRECFPSQATCDGYRAELVERDSWHRVSTCSAAVPEASKTMEAACDRGDGFACAAASNAYRAAGRHSQALDAASKGCKAGDAAACMRVAEALETGEDVPHDLVQALRYYGAACKLGERAACARAEELAIESDSP